LDTWFSSGLWTFSTLGWPEKTEDLKNYHPTTLINPGYEILFFWVGRMILMSQFLLGEIPFKTVFLHGILRDKNGKKFSKSSGNNIDPAETIEKYGADALRMSLISGTSSGNDSNYDENKVKGYKNFANKVWNITRFILENTKDHPASDPDVSNSLIEEFKKIVEDITSDMNNYRFHLAAEKIYQYIWHRFADEILEESKKIIKEGGDEAKNRKNALLAIWTNCLKILHPFMPFVTEEIWSMLPLKNKKLLIVEKWPNDNQ
jgi:valyl-tRNA synthetase